MKNPLNPVIGRIQLMLYLAINNRTQHLPPGHCDPYWDDLDYLEDPDDVGHGDAGPSTGSTGS